MLDRLLIVGYGRQGRRHFDVASRFHLARLMVTVDPISTARATGTEHFADLTSALEGCEYDAAVVASPTSTHAEVVERLLLRGIPTLVEKPMAADMTGAERVVEVMNSTGTALFVGYVERFNPVVQLLDKVIRSHVTGTPISLTMKRFGLPPADPPDADVIHDLSVHDIDLAFHLNARRG